MKPLFFYSLLFLGITSSAEAATYTVNNSNDTGAGSLRDFVKQANDGDSINIPSGTYTLSSSLKINKSLTITGTGSNLVILDGANAQRLIRFSPSSSQSTLQLSHIQFQNAASNDGLGGAALLIDSGVVSITSSTFYNNASSVQGGAINNKGRLTLSRSTLVNNHAPTGSAINNLGTMTIHYSTLVNNNLTNNSAAAINNAGSFTSETSLYFNSTDCSGTGAIQSLGYNAQSSNSCIFDTGNLTPDYFNITTLPVSSNLSNAGTTQVLMPLNTLTTTIDKADSNCGGTDQMGTSVPQNTRCDIGSVEVASAQTTIQNSNTTSSNASNNEHEGSDHEGDEKEGGIGSFNPILLALLLLNFIKSSYIKETSHDV